MRYDRARKNLDRHPNYILAAYMAPECDTAAARCVVLLVVPSSRGVHREDPHRHEGQPEERPLRRPAQTVRALLRTTTHYRRIPCGVPHPVPGDPRVNIQNDQGKAKPYQVRQVLTAIEKKEAN